MLSTSDNPTKTSNTTNTPQHSPHSKTTSRSGQQQSNQQATNKITPLPYFGVGTNDEDPPDEKKM